MPSLTHLEPLGSEPGNEFAGRVTAGKWRIPRYRRLLRRPAGASMTKSGGAPETILNNMANDQDIIVDNFNRLVCHSTVAQIGFHALLHGFGTILLYVVNRP